MLSNECGQQLTATQGFYPVARRRLPVFRGASDACAIFYAPRLVCVLPREFAGPAENEIGRLSESGRVAEAECAAVPAPARCLATRIVSAAQDAKEEAANSARAAFAPECLTLFLNNACNLKCRYCHAAPSAEPDRPISDDALRSAARLVAASCAQRQRSFTVAFHGGGEPALDETRVNQILDMVQDVARDRGVLLRTYIATNGVMSEDRARWLASRFDLIGLSCDGPPDVQDQQRPARDGHPTSPRVRRTAAILRQAGRPFHVRATITKDSLGRMAEIVDYFIEQYVPGEIRLEPVYVNPVGPTGLGPAAAAPFVAGFMAARRAAADKSVPVTTSMTRPAALYGRYCHALRQVLNLVPGEIATGCFLDSREADIVRRQVRVGAMNPGSASFDLDQDRLTRLVTQCSQPPSGCRDCLCCFQCTHGCPDVCVLENPAKPAREEDVKMGFRCHAHRLLMGALIREAADHAWRNTSAGVNQDVLDLGMVSRVAVFREEDMGGVGP